MARGSSSAWSLRRRAGAYLLAVHGALGLVAARVLWTDPRWLYLVEGILLVSIAVAVLLVRAVTVPLELVDTGAELIRTRDFGSRFRPVGQPDVDRLVDLYNGMIDRLREERIRVREQNELLDRLVEASPGGVILCDLEGRVADLNPAAERMLGAPRAALRGARIAPAGPALLGQLADVPEGTARLLAVSDGRRLRALHASFRDRGFPRDFFLLEELTGELRQSEKAAYGKVVRQISHEVNNTVGAVGSLLATLGAAEPARDEATGNALRVASERLSSLSRFVERFATLVRLPEPERRPCDVEALVEDILQLVGPSLAESGIRLRRERDAAMPAVALDKNQIEQVLLNVLKNAAEAVGRDGTIAVRTGVDRHAPWLEVVDSGPGLDEAARAQLFTPFFTTKPRGCGLGLTLVAEILGRHRFPFSLDSPPGGGARFRVVLSAA